MEREKTSRSNSPVNHSLNDGLPDCRSRARVLGFYTGLPVVSRLSPGTELTPPKPLLRQVEDAGSYMGPIKPDDATRGKRR